MLYKSYNLYVQGYNKVINNSYLYTLYLKVSKFYRERMLSQDFHQSSWSFTDSYSVLAVHAQFKVKPSPWTSTLRLAFLTIKNCFLGRTTWNACTHQVTQSDNKIQHSIFKIYLLKSAHRTKYSDFFLEPKTLPFGHIPLKSILCQ